MLCAKINYYLFIYCLTFFATYEEIHRNFRVSCGRQPRDEPGACGALMAYGACAPWPENYILNEFIPLTFYEGCEKYHITVL